MPWLPVMPKLPRSLNVPSRRSGAANRSALSTQPADSAGNTPYRLSDPKRDEPSARRLAPSRYLSAIDQLAREKNDTRLLSFALPSHEVMFAALWMYSENPVGKPSPRMKF